MAALLLGATSLSCATEPRSCDLDTDALRMWAIVNDLGDAVEIEVEFEASGVEGVTLTLCPERDLLEINGVVAEEVRALGHVHYTVELEQAQDSYEIALTRDATPPVTAVVEMPPSFAILSPEPGSMWSRNAPLEVSWDPPWPGGLIEVAIEDTIGSDCIDEFGVRYEVEDSGSFIIAGASLASTEMGVACDVTLALTRRVVANYPPELHAGGEITGFVRRRQPFTSTE